MKVFIYCIFFLLSLGGYAQENKLLQQIEEAPAKELEKIKIPTASVHDYSLVTDYAVHLFRDTANKDDSFKGEYILTVIADTLKKQISRKYIDPKDEDVAALLEKYNQLNFFIYQPKTNDLLKLARHACQGDSEYIYSRFRQKWYFFPVMILLGVFVIGSLLNVIGVFKWRFRRAYNIFLVVFILLMLVFALVFHLTCEKYVTEKSFYGIRL